LLVRNVLSIESGGGDEAILSANAVNLSAEEVFLFKIFFCYHLKTFLGI